MNEKIIYNNDQIEIPSSKLKLSLLLLGSILFVVGGIFFILHPSDFNGQPLHNRPQWLIITVGYSSVIFFGSCGIAIISRVFSSKPGLIIDNNGITIPGAFFSDFVSWNMIKKFDIINISRNNLVAIYLKRPNDYVKKISNPIARKLAQFNLNSSGTPLSISSNGLKCNTNELLTLLQKKLDEFEIEHSKSEIK